MIIWIQKVRYVQARGCCALRSQSGTGFRPGKRTRTKMTPNSSSYYSAQFILLTQESLYIPMSHTYGHSTYY